MLNESIFSIYCCENINLVRRKNNYSHEKLKGEP